MSFSSLLLAADIELEKVTFPVYASPKIDGFRATVYNDILRTRSNKPLANMYVREKLSQPMFRSLDGELCCGEPTDPLVFKRSSSLLRKFSGEPDFTWWIFDDYFSPRYHFETRLKSAAQRVEELQQRGIDFVKLVPHTIINDMQSLQEYRDEMLALGYEGIMIRRPDGIYKWGRSTVKEGILLKWKEVTVEEAVITGCVELMHNENESFTNELGKTSRRDLKENKVGSGMLGSYLVKSPKYDREFKVSCGSMTHAERCARWAFRDVDIGNIVRFKHFEYGNYEVPRQAIFEAFRPAFDMDAAWLEQCEKAGIKVRQ